ncbi:hypothetical protein GCM10009117_00630 [Gangjinia marincola]|uniref:Uncharacterized protein n=1 Tax=Gangjinia marincola TaxID=578463 RepID=A0ABN1MD26_9FLAO
MRIILIWLFLILNYSITHSQVGINTSNPSQMLDVIGQIQVGEDASSPNEEGTIRYSSAGQDIEGFASGEWKSLTSKNSIPQNAIFVQIADFGASASSTWAFVDYNISYDNSGSFGGSFLPVPTGKILVIEQICATSTVSGPSNEFYAGVRVSTSSGSGFNPQIFITGGSANGNTCLQANKAPLLIATQGRSIQVWNSSTSDTSVRFIITGYLVDSLIDYYKL